MQHSTPSINERIKDWRDVCLRSGSLTEGNIDELEDHLREEIDQLSGKGLSEEEAFLIALKRMGKLDSLSEEFRKINTHNLWKQLFSEPGDAAEKKTQNRELVLVVLLAIAAILTIEIPQLFGLRLEENALFYLKNLSFFVLPFITLFFIIKRQVQPSIYIVIALAFVVSLVLMNVFPFTENSHTFLLSFIHLPLFLWFFSGLADTGNNWRDNSPKMDFLRLTGETFIYTTLLCCGVAVIGLLLMALFSAIDIRAENAVREQFMIPFCLAAPIIAVYLVDQKKSVVENFAPILAKIFAPILLVVMLIFLTVMVALQKSPFMERDFLIGFDLMLILVLGVVFYILSTRDENKEAGIYDWISLILILVALVIDLVALSAIVFRLSSFGVSPNKLAALGENILVFINLAGLAVLFVQFFRKKISFVQLEQWQIRLLPFYAIWLGFVALGFPLIFQYK